MESGRANPALKRTLTAINLTTLGVGAIVGAGIFVVPGVAAANYAGPSVVFSYLISGVACAFAALCYAEMASTVPIAGSAYNYAYATMGRTIAWIIGWDLILEYSLGATIVAVGWSGYVVSFLREAGVNVSLKFASAPLEFDAVTHTWSRTGALINLPAMVIVVLVTILLVIGVQASANVNSAIVAIKLAIVVTFIIAGVGFVSTKNWITATNPAGNFIPPNLGEFGHFGWSGVVRASAFVFFAYIGFDAVATAAQEAKNPERDVPIGIISSLMICTILYTLVAFVLTGVVPYDRLDVSNPIAAGIDAIGMDWLSPMVKLGAIAALSSVILVLLLAQPRIFFSMASDGLLPPVVSRVHARFRTPYLPTIITGLLVTMAAGFLPVSVPGELVSIGTLLAFAIVCAGVLILRITQPGLHRPFRTPFVFVTAPAGVVTSILMMFGLPRDTWLRLIVWMAIGLIVYLMYGLREKRRI
ncbi:MAG TPA: amino acid permease [Blastocatellia bacterium]|nr:amino acid permease [Blastocatellia bacterium]